MTEPVRHLVRKRAKQHLADVKQRTGQYPAEAEFRAAALEYLRR